jgi:putative membrane protein
MKMLNGVPMMTGSLWSLLIWTCALPALAQQTANPAGAAPDTPGVSSPERPVAAAPDHPNTVDQVFARQAAIGGLAEVEMGKLAADRAQNDAVKQFARRMAEDHGKSNDRLTKLARANKASLPRRSDVDPDQKAMRAQLEKLRGAEFDAAYIASQVGAHQTTAHLLEHEIGAGQDVRLKDYAKETLPTVMRHLELARQVQQDLAAKAVPDRDRS